MGKSAPAAPTPPDPTVVANAQSAANKDTAFALGQINRTGSVTPYGATTWANSLGNISETPAVAAGADGSGATAAQFKVGDQSFGTRQEAQDFLNQNGQWNQLMQLTPDQQKALDSQQQLTQSLYGLANTQSGRISSTLDKPLDFSGQPAMTSGLNMSGAPALATSLSTSGLPQVATGLDRSKLPSISTDASYLPTGLDSSSLNRLPTGVDASSLNRLPAGVNSGALPSQISGLDMSALPRMPGSPQDVNGQVTQAMYGQATSRLDPQWQQAQQKMEAQLSQQGIPVGSDAYNKAMDSFGRAKNDAYTSALNSSIVSGAQQGATDYGLALQGVQTGVGVQTANAGLANQAGQFGLASQGLNSQIAGQAFNSNLASQGLNSQIAGQAFNSNLAAQGENAQIAGSAAQTRLAQQQAAEQAAVGEQMSGAQLAQQARQQGVSEQLSNAQLAAAARAQGVSEQQIQAQLAEQARQQGISEQSYLYDKPLNEAIALMGGGQIQGPQMQAPPQTQIAPTDVTGAYGLAQQGNLAAYQAKTATQSANTGAAAGLAGAAITAAAFF